MKDSKSRAFIEEKGCDRAYANKFRIAVCLCWLFAFCLNVGNTNIAHGETGDVGSLTLLVETIGSTNDTSVQAALLEGILSGLEGRRNLEAPDGWAELNRALARSQDLLVREKSLELSQLFGDLDAVERAFAIVNDATADVAQRRSTLNLLLNQQNKRASRQLAKLLRDPAMTLDAIRGYAVVENVDAPSILMECYPRLNPQQKRAVIETLASRKTYAESLLVAIKMGDITRDEIPAQVARSLDGMLGERFASVYGDVRNVAIDRRESIAKYKELCSTAALAEANASRGRAVFKKTCSACHKLYGEGGGVGPDLTGSNRANLDYILLNSVDPSYDVPDAYKTVSVLTLDGRVVNGVLAEEDSQRIVLKTAEQPRVVIAKDDIEVRKVSSKSMMPDGQLDQMNEQEVLDLIKYLRTTEQVRLEE
ncbi:MAG: c-type cytochrome [Planctomycetota bacterium]